MLTCQLLDSQLAEIEDATENNFIKNVVKPLNATTGWLIGATDKVVEGEFVWMNSKRPLTRTFTDWAPGEPGTANHDESCVCLYRRGSYTWVDVSCEVRQNYICEVQQSVGPSQVAPVVG